MSYDSLGISDPKCFGGNYAVVGKIRMILTMSVTIVSIGVKQNNANAGNTKYDEIDVLASYVAAVGNTNRTARLVGYRGPAAVAANSAKSRILCVNADTIKFLHKYMKLKKNKLPPYKNSRGNYNFFYVMERLLELRYKGYKSIVPPGLKNWKPSPGTRYWRFVHK